MIAGFQLLGGHWALLQTAAWVGMVIDYSKTEGVEAGITNAFDERGQLEKDTFCSITFCSNSSRTFIIRPRFFGIKFGQHF